MDSCELKLVDPERVLAVQASLPEADIIDALAEVFGLLSDPNRLRLLASLLEAGELCVCDLAAAAGMGGVHHLARPAPPAGSSRGQGPSGRTDNALLVSRRPCPHAAGPGPRARMRALYRRRARTMRHGDHLRDRAIPSASAHQ